MSNIFRMFATQYKTDNYENRLQILGTKLKPNYNATR